MMSLAKTLQPAALPGFETINRYWDSQHQCWAAKILPGEFYVTTQADEIICTTLGSCVSACIRDASAGVAGMNHFMLPAGRDASDDWYGKAARYGSVAMELLINEMLKRGASKKAMTMKLVGGGRIIRSLSDIGQHNIDFVLDYARLEHLNIIATDFGDIYPRKVIFHPDTGIMRVKRLKSMHNDTLIRREQAYVNDLKTQPASGEVELF